MKKFMELSVTLVSNAVHSWESNSCSFDASTNAEREAILQASHDFFLKECFIRFSYKNHFNGILNSYWNLTGFLGSRDI